MAELACGNLGAGRGDSDGRGGLGLGELAAEVRAGRHPAELAGARLELPAASPGGTGLGRRGGRPLRDGAAARHGGAAGPGPQRPPGRELRHLPRDTLTFSSLEGTVPVAVQRELVTLGGAVVEQQELVLPFSTGASPLPFLAAAGTLLLLGVPPEELPARLRLPA
ncbi:MAG: hypothetical protein ACLRWQ_10180 [Flavonifractor plautii]